MMRNTTADAQRDFAMVRPPVAEAPGWVHRAMPSIGRWAFVLFLALLILYPLVELVRQPLENLSDVWEDAQDLPRLGTVLFNTVALAAGSMLLATIAAMGLAWCRANLSGRLGATAHLLALLPLMVPPLAGVTGWAFLLSPKVGYLNQILRFLFFPRSVETGPFDIYSLSWIVIITGIYLIPFAFIFIHAGLSNLDTRLEDAARSAGSGWLGTQFRIVIPLLRPALIYGGALVALLALGQFTAALLLGRTKGIDVITTQLYRLTGTPPPDYPLATFIALPILVIALIGVAVQRKALSGGLRFIMAGKGTGRERGHRVILFLPILIYSFIVVVPPIIGLVLVALSPYWGEVPEFSKMSFAAFSQIANDPVALSAVANSLKLAAAATVGAVALSMGAALAVLRTRGISRQIVDYIINIPLAVPAILFGMGILVSFALGPATRLIRELTGINLYGGGAVLVLAYIVLAVPHGTRLVMSGLAQINPQLESAARVFGSTALGTVIRIVVPLLRRNLVSAAMLMFMLSSHEFAASSLLIGPDTQVMSTVLYGQWDTGTYPRVAAMALIMVTVAVISLGLIGLFDRSPLARKGSLGDAL